MLNRSILDLGFWMCWLIWWCWI